MVYEFYQSLINQRTQVTWLFISDIKMNDEISTCEIGWKDVIQNASHIPTS